MSKKVYEKTCMDCGITFTTLSCRALRCEKCRKIAKYEYNKLVRSKYQKPKYKISRVFPPRKSIKEILRDLKKYNEEHGTYLSYGQYIALIEKGEY